MSLREGQLVGGFNSLLSSRLVWYYFFEPILFFRSTFSLLQIYVSPFSPRRKETTRHRRKEEKEKRGLKREKY